MDPVAIGAIIVLALFVLYVLRDSILALWDTGASISRGTRGTVKRDDFYDEDDTA